LSASRHYKVGVFSADESLEVRLAVTNEQAISSAYSNLESQNEHANNLPVLRPKLPSFGQLAPYLQAIDARRFYSNGGPLSSKLQGALSRHLGCPEDTLITAASGTAGLTATLLALDLPENSLCLMPSWTFAATPHAALAAGMKPQFLDVDRRTWALNPAAVRQTIAESASQPGAVIVVSPFGAPIDITAWEAFQKDTGVPVIVDAAAGFDTVRFSSLISVVSLHATKVFAAGEGGFIVTPSRQIRDRVRACSNFGFNGSRVAQWRSINSKMSEYHAAVALAGFDCWPSARLRHLQIAAWYRQALKASPLICLQPGYGEGWACGTTNVLIQSDSAESIARCLLRDGIETRMWWGTGCHTQPAFANCERGELPETEFLAARVLGLPHFVDMTKADVSRVAASLAKALSSRAHGRRRTG
jgi:dTDP-4-amino-4,6-dideoxygalactose transaminase